MSAAALDALRWTDLIEESPPLKGDARFLREFFLPARGRYRFREFSAAAAQAKRLKTPAGLAVRGRLARILGERAEAEELLRQALARDPGCVEALAYRAESILVGRPKQALEELERAARSAPAAAQLDVWRGYALFLLGDLAAALRALDQAHAGAAAPATAFLLRGILRERRRNLFGADEDLSGALALWPASAGLYTLRGVVRFKLGRADAAVEDAHQGLLLHPENMDTFVRILYLSAGKNAVADPAAERALLLAETERLLAADPRRSWALAARAGVLGESSLQVEPLRQAAALDPERAWIRAFLGRALTGVDALEEGLAELSEAARLAPSCGWIRGWRAQTLRKLKRPEDALKDLDEGVRLDPDYRLAFAWRSLHRRERGELEGALEDMERCLEALDRPGFRHQRAALEWRVRPGSARPLADLAVLISRGARFAFAYAGLNEGLPSPAAPDPEALDLSEKRLAEAAKRNPKDALAHAWLARARLNAGREQEALSSLDKALALDPKCWCALAWRAEQQVKTGRWAEALPLLERALALRPDFLVARLWRAAALFAGDRKAQAAAELLAAEKSAPADAATLRAWARAAMARLSRA